MNLFDITKGIENACNVKPRAANDAEIFAYLEWQRQRHGLADLEERELCWLDHNTGRTRSTLHLICIGATFGRRTAAPRWEGEGREREYLPAQYENGAYSIVMPGWNAHRQNVTMETLDDAGEIITSSTLPAEPKKGGVIWDKAAVHKAVGPVAKPAKASKRKAAPTVEIEAPASATEAAQEREEALCPVTTSAEPVEVLSGPEIGSEPIAENPGNYDLDAQGEAMAAFIEALDTLPAVSTGTPTVGKRTPAHERAIRRAWAERKARRSAARAAIMHYEDAKAARAERNEAVQEARKYQAWWEGISRDAAALCAERDRLAYKRRRSTLLARQRGYGLVMLHNVARARLDELQAELAKARQVPTYLDDTGMERHDAAAVAFDQGRHALEKSESLERTVEGAKAKSVRGARRWRGGPRRGVDAKDAGHRNFLEWVSGVAAVATATMQDI